MSQGFSEEDVRRLEEEMARLSVDDVLMQSLSMLINIGVRRAGLAAPPEGDVPERDLPETRRAIDAARAILGALGDRDAEQLGPFRDALSQLQMAYVQLAGGPAGPAAGGEPAGAAEPDGPPEPGAGAGPGQPEGPGPAQSSGRLWVPGSDPRP